MARRGLSLVELILAAFIVFLVGSFMASFFVTSSQSAKRVLEQEEIETVVVNMLETYATMPVPRIPTGCMSVVGGLGTPISVDVYLSDFAPDPRDPVRRLVVTASNPNGRTATVERAVLEPLRVGLTMDDQKRRYARISATAGQDRRIDASGSVNPMPPLPTDVGPIGMHIDIEGTVLYAISADAIFRNNTPKTGGSWTAGISAPPNALLGGLSGTDIADELWATDRQFHCIRRFKPALSSWDRVEFPNQGEAPLGDLGGLFVTDGGQNVWVADLTNHCVRRYDTGADTWSPPIQSPFGMELPLSIGGTGDGSFIYVLTRKRINMLNTGSMAWTSLPFDGPDAAALETETPAAIVVDRTENLGSFPHEARIVGRNGGYYRVSIQVAFPQTGVTLLPP